MTPDAAQFPDLLNKLADELDRLGLEKSKPVITSIIGDVLACAADHAIAAKLPGNDLVAQAPEDVEQRRLWGWEAFATIASQAVRWAPDSPIDAGETVLELRLRAQRYAIACRLLAVVVAGTAAPRDLDPIYGELLIATYQLRAFDEASRRVGDDIAARADGVDEEHHWNRRNGAYKHALRSLVLQGLLESKKTKDGGYWLTSAGRSMAAAEARKRQKSGEPNSSPQASRSRVQLGKRQAVGAACGSV